MRCARRLASRRAGDEGSASRDRRRSRGSFASSHALRAPPGNENAPEAPAALTLFHRKLRMTVSLCRTRNVGDAVQS